MSFIIHLNLREFIRDLNSGNTVYYAAYSLKDKPTGNVLLTSDAGISGGSIHAVQMNIAGDTADGLALAVAAREKIEEFLTSRQIVSKTGVIMTVGLQDALRFWSAVCTYSLSEIDDTLKIERERATS